MPAGSSWCRAGGNFEVEVRVRKALDGYIYVRVDIDEHPDAGAAYGIASMPTLLVLEATGRELRRLTGTIGLDLVERTLVEAKRAAADGRKE